MTKKNYIEFANMLAGEIALANHSKDSKRILTVENIVRSTADVFARDNGMFDRQRFYEACGMKE